MSSYKRYITFTAILTIIPIITMAAWVVKNDPYWIFSKSPEWSEIHHGHNRVLDIRHRLAKPLQVITRQSKVVILGSSRVYRGMPTHKYSDDMYNFGISSLRIREMYGYLRHVIRWTDVSEVVLGLDYFMFDSNLKYEAGYDASVMDFSYILKALPTSLLTKVAYDDVKMAKSGIYSGDGYWTYSGYKATNPRGVRKIKHVLNSFYNTKNKITEEEYSIFERIIKLCKSHDIKLTVFISPLNQLMLKRMVKQGEDGSFKNWKKHIHGLARENSVLLFDYSEENPFVSSVNIQSSTQAWIDPSHYSSLVGEWMLKDMGVVSRLLKDTND